MVYKIVRGNEDKKLELLKQNGVWALHFRRRLKDPVVFDIIIHGKSAESNHLENHTYEKPLVLRIKLSVTE